MLYPDATSALAADRIRRYRAEAEAWRLIRLARAAKAARAARRDPSLSTRAAPNATPAAGRPRPAAHGRA